jgi:hypothetical protein
MSGRGLKIALAVSVALNLFALAGGVAFAVSRAKVDQHVAEQRQPGRAGGFRALVAELSPETRREVRARMRATVAARCVGARRVLRFVGGSLRLAKSCAAAASVARAAWPPRARAFCLSTLRWRVAAALRSLRVALRRHSGPHTAAARAAHCGRSSEHVARMARRGAGARRA